MKLFQDLEKLPKGLRKMPEQEAIAALQNLAAAKKHREAAVAKLCSAAETAALEYLSHFIPVAAIELHCTHDRDVGKLLQETGGTAAAEFLELAARRIRAGISD